MDIELWGDELPDGSRLRLRPWSEQDIVPLVDVCRDPVMRRHTSLPVAQPGEVRQWLDDQRRGWDTGGRLSFAVHDLPGSAGEQRLPGSAREQRLVGGVVLKRGHRGSASAEVGYWTAGDARGRGIAPRAVEALCVWSREALAADGLERWELLHQIDNLASCRVAEKSRFRFHRILPAQPPFPLDGHLHIRQVSDMPVGVTGAETVADLGERRGEAGGPTR